MKEKEITLKQLVEFYVRTSPISGAMDNSFTQELAAKYFVWKAKRKLKKYLDSREFGKIINWE